MGRSGSALGQGQGLGLELGRASLGPIFQTTSRDPSSKLRASEVRAPGAAFRGGAGSRVSGDAQSRVVAIGGGSRVMPGALCVLSMEPSRGAGSCRVSGSFMPRVEFRGPDPPHTGPRPSKVPGICHLRPRSCAQLSCGNRGAKH